MFDGATVVGAGGLGPVGFVGEGVGNGVHGGKVVGAGVGVGGGHGGKVVGAGVGMGVGAHGSGAFAETAAIKVRAV